MLTAMRRNVQRLKWTLWAVIITMILGLILLYGTMRTGPGPGGVILQVNDIKMTDEDYRNAYNETMNYYRQVYKDNFDQFAQNINFEDLANNKIMRTALLLSEAKRLDLEVNQAELAAYIKELPYFQYQGQFNSAIYHEVLRRNRMSPPQFEASLARDLLVEKVTRKVNEMVQVSRSEVWQDYKKRNDKTKIKYVLFNPDDYKDQVTVTDKEVRARFDENQSMYKIPEKVRMKYIYIEKEKVKRDLDATKEEIEQAYNENKEDYRQEEQVQARHILWKVETDASPEIRARTRQKAEEILEQIKEGADFGEMAKMYSEDSSAPKGGDLGFFGRGQMVANFEKTAFDLNIGQVSDVVQTEFGYHIIKVEGKKEPGYKPLEEVSEEIKSNIINQKANEIVREKMRQAENAQYSGESLESIAKLIDADVKETKLFAKGENIEGIIKSKAIEEAAFSLKINEVSEPIDSYGLGYYIISPIEKVEAHQAKFEEVKDDIREEITNERAAEQAQKDAQNLLNQLRRSDWETATAESEELKPQETREFSQMEYIPKIGRDQKFAAKIFKLNQGMYGEVEELANGSYIVYQVLDFKWADKEQFDAEFLNFKDRLLNDKQRKFFAWYIDHLKKQAEIIDFRNV